MAAWNNDSQGFIECTWADLKFVCHGENIEQVKQNLSKLQAKKIIEIEFVTQNSDQADELVKIIYPPMVHACHVSQVRAQAGSAGGKESSKKKSLKNNRQAKSKQNGDNDIDIENDNDSVNAKEEGSVKGGTIVNPFGDPFVDHWLEWKDYKSSQHGFKYKGQQTEQKAIDQLFSLSEGSLSAAIAIINQSISNGWKGLFEIKKPENGIKNGHGKIAGATQLSGMLRSDFANSQ
jgi:hypothetical protein